MAARVEVPITPAVLSWALGASGVSVESLADAIALPGSSVRSWLNGTERPSLTELRAVARHLDRQLAVFLLPEPPEFDGPAVAFRHPLKRRRALVAEERRFLRRAARLQSAESWLAIELGEDSPRLPVMTLDMVPAHAAERFRTRLNIPVEIQFEWTSSSAAFDHWRAAVEAEGILVAKYAIGEDACRGFSLWDPHAPLVALNTAWPIEARIFTLFHEVGHLLTRSNSACEQPAAPNVPTDAAERWCEQFAAAVLVPVDTLAATARVTTVRHLSDLARRYRVSLRAMAISLIDAGKATWALYRSIPLASEIKPRAGGGKGRTLREIREDEVGWASIERFINATKREVITESQALDYLELGPDDFALLTKDASLR